MLNVFSNQLALIFSSILSFITNLISSFAVLVFLYLQAANALNLNNIPYLGAMLRVGRPSKYTGEITPSGNWEDILAKYMSGELKLPAQGGTAAITTPAPIATPPSPVATSRVVRLKNMLTSDDLASDAEYAEVVEDTRDECGQFGLLKSVAVPRDGKLT